MRAPGEETVLGERPAARTAAPSTSAGFLPIFTESGPTDAPEYCVSLAHLESLFGGRLADHPEGYDTADTAFHEGATGIYVKRIVGKNPVAASKVLVDGEGKTVATAEAKYVGEYGNNLKVKVTVAGEEATAVIETTAGQVLKSSGAKPTLKALIEWSEGTAIPVLLVAGESEKLPKAQTITLTGGTADLANATATQLDEGLGLLAEDLGPGQVAIPNFAGDEAAQLVTMVHCGLRNRRALLDDAIDADVAELVAHGTALAPAEGDVARFAALFGSWAIAPGLATGTTRTVPYSGVQMGLIARSEAEGNGPGKAVAGSKRGKARWVIGLVKTFTKEERAELSAAGVTCAILKKGVPTTFDNRTLVDETTDPDWVGLSESRLIMGVRERTRQVLEGFEFEDIDGHGYIFNDLAGEIGARACKPYYEADELYGESPEEAFVVNTGPQINTPASIEAEEIKAQVAVRAARTGRFLSAEVVKVPISEEVA